MPARRKTAPAKSRKKPVKKRTRKPKEGELDQEVVSMLFDKLEDEEACERRWSAMTSESHDDADAWAPVEEHLLRQAHERGHNIRRWKYFGK